MNKITTRTAVLSYNSLTRILWIKIIEGSDVELADAIQNYEATMELTKGDRYLVVVDGRVNLSISREARAFAAQAKNNEKSIASALIITSTANKLIGNFYINVNKPSIPTRIFSSEEKALEWLQGFLYLTEKDSYRIKAKL